MVGKEHAEDSTTVQRERDIEIIDLGNAEIEEVNLINSISLKATHKTESKPKIITVYEEVHIINDNGDQVQEKEKVEIIEPVHVPHPTPLARVLAVFPDALISQVEANLEKSRQSICREKMDVVGFDSQEEEAIVDLSWSVEGAEGPEIDSASLEDRAVEMVVAAMMEHGYLKVEASSTSSFSALEMPATSKTASDPVEVDFSAAAHIAQPSSPLYLSEAYALLKHNFPQVKEDGLRSLFHDPRHCKGHYSPAVTCLEEALHVQAFYGDLSGRSGCQLDGPFSFAPSNDVDVGRGEAEERALCPAPTPSDQVRASCQASGLNIKIKNARRKNIGRLSILVSDPLLVKEVNWIMARKRNAAKEAWMKRKEEMIQAKAENEGALVDCGCCCSAMAFELLVQCSEG